MSGAAVTALRVVLIVGQAVALGLMLAGLFALAGCAYYDWQWAKVPPGALEKCQARADEVAADVGARKGRLFVGTGLLWCDRPGQCTCRVSLDKQR